MSIRQDIDATRLAPFALWLARGERGLSSEAIVSTLTGVNVGSVNDHPYDPADLMRCVKLLDAHPFAVDDFKRLMPSVSPTWARMVERWDEMTALLAEEEQEGTGMAPRTYALMREIRGEA